MTNIETENKYGLLPDMDWIDINKLVINDKYQRDTLSNRSKVNIAKIVDDFKWSKFSPLTVAAIANEEYAVIDGQHRLAAVKQLGDIEQVPCWIIPDCQTAAQADSFIGINKNRVAVTNYGIYKSSVAAGDPLSLKIDQFCQSNGITIVDQHTLKGLPEETLALGKIKNLIKANRQNDLAFAVKIIRQAYPFLAGQLKAELITFLADNHRASTQNNKILNEALIIATLRDFGCVSKISLKAHELRMVDTGISPAKAFAKIFINRYNEVKKNNNQSLYSPKNLGGGVSHG